MRSITESEQFQDLTLVIPSRNEAVAIQGVVREWWDQRPRASTMEILVVDDASTDETPRVLSEIQQEIPIRVVRNSVHQGYGGSLKIGVRHTQTPWVAFADGDGQYDPGDLPTLLNLLGGGSDMAIGVRTRRADPLIRRIVSHGFRAILSLFFVTRARDPTVGLRVGRTDTVRSISEQTRYMNGSFLNEFMVRLERAGVAYAEAPVRHRPRPFGESKIASNRLLLRVSIQQVIALIRLWREFHRFSSQGVSAGQVSAGIRQ